MKSIYLLLISLILAACATRPPAPEPRPERDGAPRQSLDPARIADMQPRAEPITAMGNVSPYTVMGKTYEVMTDYHGFTQRGIASWYGTKFHGRLTSNGEIYDLYQMTAAHKTLPIPVYVRVTNLDNGRSAVVRVNDRGPFHDDRIIDLSYAAAVRLGFAESGTAPVEIEVIDTDNGGQIRVPSANLYFLQVGAFGARERAVSLQGQLSAQTSHPIQVMATDRSPVMHRVRIGPFESFLEAERVRQELRTTPIGETQLFTERRPRDTAANR